MTFNGYQRRAAATADYPDRGTLMGLIYCALGVVGEAGEYANKTKKILRDNGYELSAVVRRQLIDEAGDICWYLSQIATELGVTFETIGRLNLAKLRDRADRNAIAGSGDIR